jgi:hypothetical protein
VVQRLVASRAELVGLTVARGAQRIVEMMQMTGVQPRDRRRWSLPELLAQRTQRFLWHAAAGYLAQLSELAVRGA